MTPRKSSLNRGPCAQGHPRCPGLHELTETRVHRPKAIGPRTCVAWICEADAYDWPCPTVRDYAERNG
jgi:hypothetical protein